MPECILGTRSISRTWAAESGWMGTRALRALAPMPPRSLVASGLRRVAAICNVSGQQLRERQRYCCLTGILVRTVGCDRSSVAKSATSGDGACSTPRPPRELHECRQASGRRLSSREIAVDWRLTTQPNSDEQGDTQLKSRSPEVLTQQHSDNLGATQHNSAKLGQFGGVFDEFLCRTADEPLTAVEQDSRPTRRAAHLIR
jgi:hypothetical protein